MFEINTYAWQFSSGKQQPRGAGSWAFSPSNPNGASWSLDSAKFFGGPYGEAKRQAIAWARSAGFASLYLCP